MDTQSTTTPPEINETVQEAATENAPKPKKTAKQFLKQAFFFTCFSAGAAIVQIVSFTLLNEVCTLPYWPAYLISLLLSVIFNFTFNRKVTFKSTSNIPRAFSLVILYYLIFTPLSTMLGQNLTDIGWNEYVILIGTMLINFVTEFFYQKLYVFDKKSTAQTETDASEQTATGDTKTDADAVNSANADTDSSSK